MNSYDMSMKGTEERIRQYETGITLGNIASVLMFPINLIRYPFLVLNRKYWESKGVKYIDDATMNGMPEVIQEKIRGYVNEGDIKKLFPGSYGFTNKILKKADKQTIKKIANLSHKYEIYRNSPALQRFYGIYKTIMEKEYLPIDKEYELNIDSFNIARTKNSEVYDEIIDAINKMQENINKRHKEYDRINFLKVLASSDEIFDQDELSKLWLEYQKDKIEYVGKHLKGLYRIEYNVHYGIFRTLLDVLFKILPASVGYGYVISVEKYKAAYDDEDPNGYFNKRTSMYEDLAKRAFGEDIEKYIAIFNRSNSTFSSNDFVKKCRKSEFFKDIKDEKSLDAKHKELVKKFHPDNGGDVTRFVSMNKEYENLKSECMDMCIAA